jgi:ABC-type uncharacterized transport system fused permease/ATPase subunit
MRKKHLHLKGWSKEEIKKAENILSEAEKKKHPDVKKVENSLYWFTLIIGILGTVILSLIMIPILVVSNNLWIIIIIKDLHWLEHHHHLLISLLIPIVAIFNFFIVVNRVNSFNTSLGIMNHHNPVMVGIVYFVCFLAPYFVFLVYKRR